MVIENKVINVATKEVSTITLSSEEEDAHIAASEASEAAYESFVDAPSNLELYKGLTALIATVDAIPTVDLAADTCALKTALDDYIEYFEG